MTEKQTSSWEFKIKKDYYGYLFIAPFIIGFLMFGLYPVYNTLCSVLPIPP